MIEFLREPLRVAVVGLGYWGPNLVRNLHEVEDAEVAWICDLDTNALDVIGRRYPAVKRTTSFDEVLADETVDAIAIATPVTTHAPLATAALEAGKHVFVEKPLAASSAEAAALLELADDRGLTLMPGHTFLYSPAVNMVAEMIRSGELGDIYFISTSRVNLGLHQKDVSVAWDLGPHDFSILRYWLDETPVAHQRARAQLRAGRHAGRRVHQPRVRVGAGRARRDRVVGADEAPPDDDLWLAQDGRLRRHVE